ncbi:hypothetical protein [Saccharopolyspora sp. ASAGF58]|uniref:hypothetical protein n=1 Tax=Saccharopolyspora sp. ASAGF58 TaxID=2719023 RepID=UPI00143FFA9D|nr:hypothetical protein [Saccharopolyspora sp. ASAGF58]QIZ39161.1 hypothetical protein FDZ84_37680 [Saccharopolyspora sp. ASAGF58]
MLTPEEEGELDLRREIEAYTKKKNDLQKQARERNRAIADIKELEALPQSAEIKDRLERLREQVLGLPDVAESLKETKGRLAEKKEKLDGLGWIAGVGASGQQGEQDAMVLSGVSESAGAGREASPVGSDLGEWLAWANADLGVSGVAGSAESAGAGREASPDGGVEPFPEAVLEEDSAGVPAAPGAVPVGRWSDADVREEIKGARKLGLSSEEKDAVRLTVQSTHDPQKLRGAVSVDDVMALVAARGRGLDGDWARWRRFPGSWRSGWARSRRRAVAG